MTIRSVQGVGSRVGWIVGVVVSVTATGALLSCKPNAGVTLGGAEGGVLLPEVSKRPSSGGRSATSAPWRTSIDGIPDYYIDCVGVTHVLHFRTTGVANATRFGEGSATLRTAARLVDLSNTDLRAFCDWETCIRSNGYHHTCWVNDAGRENCRVCSSADDCNGDPLNQNDCVAHANDVGRAQCHVGLLEECELQQALRGPADSRVTQACALSRQACAGTLRGDLSLQALAAQHETDQVTIEECRRELDVAAGLFADGGDSVVQYWKTRLAAWDGGMPPDQDAGASMTSIGEAGGDSATVLLLDGAPDGGID
jgi:hypothetical protein